MRVTNCIAFEGHWSLTLFDCLIIFYFFFRSTDKWIVERYRFTTFECMIANFFVFFFSSARSFLFLIIRAQRNNLFDTSATFFLFSVARMLSPDRNFLWQYSVRAKSWLPIHLLSYKKSFIIWFFFFFCFSIEISICWLPLVFVLHAPGIMFFFS